MELQESLSQIRSDINKSLINKSPGLHNADNYIDENKLGYFFLNNKLIYISVGNLILVQKLEKSIKLFYSNSKNLTLFVSFSEFLELINLPNFVVIENSYLLNPKMVKKIQLTKEGLLLSFDECKCFKIENIKNIKI